MSHDTTHESILITLLQFDVNFGDPELNILEIKKRISNIKIKNAELPHIILLPELFTTAYDLEAIKTYAYDLKHHPHLDVLTDLAKSNRSFIYTSIPEKDKDNSIYNTAVLLNDDGILIQHYRKIHLFKPLGELDVASPGSEVKVKKLPFGTLGLSICYDLRFPELFVSQRNLGVDFFLICAEWPIKRVNHWTTLLQSRAIENQSFVFAVNRIGSDPTGEYGGNSMIIAPDGEILSNLGLKDTTETLKINIQDINNARKLFSIVEEKRL